MPAAPIRNASALAMVLVLLACLFPGPCAAAPQAEEAKSGPAEAIAADLSVEAGRTRLSVTLSKPVSAATFVLDRPDRAIVDLPEVTFRLAPDAGKRRAGLVTSLRYGLIAPGRSRIVIDLAGPAAPVRTELVTGAEDGLPRLVIEFARTGRDAFRKLAGAAEKGAGIRVAAAPAEENGKDRRPVIVVDAGHGGVDPGATAVSGEVEKDIVLAFAGRLRDTLATGGRYRVLMTRDDDVFVPLDERVRRARAAGADLFVSIHADSISSPSISGATIYTGSERASDVESATLAARENASDASAGLAGAGEPGGVSDILHDLMVHETRSFSHRFAGHLLNGLTPSIRFSARPHREAGFRVLRAADIPSVLVELGYLSNARDTQHLLSEDWRRRTALAMAGAVDRFFALRLAGGTTAAVSP